MFGSSILEVGIGLVFVYLVVGLACTALNELIASLLRWRSRDLRSAITTLLPGEAPVKRPADQAARAADTPPGPAARPQSLAAALYAHPLIAGLFRDGVLGTYAPSYIPSRTFALALLDLVSPVRERTSSTIQDLKATVDNRGLNESVATTLRILIDQAENALKQGRILADAKLPQIDRLDTEMNQVRESIEVWFNVSMERASEWFKHKMQYLGAVVALVITVGLNVDTIRIADALSRDAALRAAIVASAEKLAATPPATPPPTALPAGAQAGLPSPSPGPSPTAVEQTTAAANSLRERIAELKDTGLPLGWAQERQWRAARRERESARGLKRTAGDNWLDYLLKVLGLLVTAAAASLGALFWFDVLNKFMTIRGAGKAPEEKQKSPKRVPEPREPGAEPA